MPLFTFRSGSDFPRFASLSDCRTVRWLRICTYQPAEGGNDDLPVWENTGKVSQQHHRVNRCISVSSGYEFECEFLSQMICLEISGQPSDIFLTFARIQSQLSVSLFLCENLGIRFLYQRASRFTYSTEMQK